MEYKLSDSRKLNMLVVRDKKNYKSKSDDLKLSSDYNKIYPYQIKCKRMTMEEF